MSQPRYEAAEALIYDPVASNRSATRAALRSVGFGPIEIAPTLDSVRQQMASRTPDLLLCELGGAESDVCALIQTIRQGQLGDDPFLVIVATTWRRDGTIVNRAINSGADDLLARPFSAAILGERLINLIERRKDFVVTSDYVGPDRRRDPTRAGLPCIGVPSSLKLKCASDLSAAAAQDRLTREVAAAKRTVCSERLRRDATQIFHHWKAVEQRRQANREFGAMLGKLQTLAADIERRAVHTEFEGAMPVAHALGAAALMAESARGDETSGTAAAFERMNDAILQLKQIIPADSDDPVAGIDHKTLRGPVGPAAGQRGDASNVVPLGRRAAG